MSACFTLPATLAALMLALPVAAQQAPAPAPMPTLQTQPQAREAVPAQPAITPARKSNCNKARHVTS